MRLEETLKERSPRAMLERACRPLAVLGRRASALAFPLNCRQAPAAIARKGYVALPARACAFALPGSCRASAQCCRIFMAIMKTMPDNGSLIPLIPEREKEREGERERERKGERKGERDRQREKERERASDREREGV